MSTPSGVVVWFTGLPSSGKSTLARAVARQLEKRGRPTALLDGDTVRTCLVPTPGYEPGERDAFYATLGRLSAELAHQGLVVLVAATAHRRAFRERARRLAPAFIEVHVATPLSECRRRDAKGLFRALGGRAGSHLPGAGADYEPPLAADVTASTGRDSRASAQVLKLLEEHSHPRKAPSSVPRPGSGRRPQLGRSAGG